MPLITNEVQAVKFGLDGTNQQINIGATATSATVNSVWSAVSGDVGWCLNVGGTAASTDFHIAAGVLVFLKTDKQSIGCISATGGDGTLSVSEVVE